MSIISRTLAAIALVASLLGVVAGTAAAGPKPIGGIMSVSGMDLGSGR